MPNTVLEIVDSAVSEGMQKLNNIILILSLM